MTDASMHLVVLLAVSWIYLTIVRFVDVNEREPVWSLAIAFGLGGVVAALLSLLVDPITLVLTPWVGAVAEELAKAFAYVACLLVFAGVARIRGWFELNDMVDGIVYGIAIGLGFSVGDTFLTNLAFAAGGIGPFEFRFGPAIVNGALAGLGHGLFGGVTGLGIGLAIETRGTIRRLIFCLLGVAGATVLNGLFRSLVHGNSLGGAAGYSRLLLSVAIPLVALVAIGLVGLARERKAIIAQLTPEVGGGALTAADLSLLGRFWQRQLRYLGLLAAGRIHECLSLAGRHNRLVQLALTKARAAGGADPSLQRQLDTLRHALRQAAPLLLFVAAVGSLTAAMTRTPPRQFDVLPSDGVNRVLGIVTEDLDQYWRKQIVFNYSTPQVGAYTNAEGTCQFIRKNAVFCGRDGNIYFDAGFLNELHDTIGDFAPAFVIAHEWGHKVQSIRGERKGEGGRWPIQHELRADCYAGEFVRSLDGTKSLEKGDIGEALEVLNRGRDPRGSPWYDPQAHGSAGQRVDAFQAGRDGVDCQNDSLWAEVRLDPKAGQSSGTPAAGSLLSRVPRAKGRFELVKVASRPDWLTTGMVEAVFAKYRAPDGAEVDVVRYAFITPAGAESEFLNDSTSQIAGGYRVVNQGLMKDGERVIGRWLLMSGSQQITMHTNRQVYEWVRAAEGIAWEFATSKVP